MTKPRNEGLDPREVISPRDRWVLLEVLYEGENFSMAIGRWKNPTHWQPCLALRWNGKKGEKGNPVSHGYPTWFNVPDELAEVLLQTELVTREKREFAARILAGRRMSQ
ncbi:hypothetical protein [Thiocapsa sp. UBA6158]|uniref:hypothetical protein n=1 Tax=Thiocapsa sp. UBA6158 TaxID=1947692 RepID=UPI0025EB30D6|nr:hypothetical protein [Thiocapsa sp. UBA6158]